MEKGARKRVSIFEDSEKVLNLLVVLIRLFIACTNEMNVFLSLVLKSS